MLHFFLVLCLSLKFVSAIGGSRDKFNVVLFLAQPDPKGLQCQPLGLKYLSFREKARVKHCDSDQSDELQQYPATPGNDCSRLLKVSLFTLISYCRNMIGMTTALACAENNTFTNGLRAKRSPDGGSWPAYRPWKTTALFYPKPRRRLTDKNVITNPEHSEVFRIRSKRSKHRLPKEEEDRCGAEPKPKSDFLGVIATIKMTFFGKLIPDEKKPDECESEEQPIKILEDSAQKQPVVDELNFFDLVKETLESVQEACQNHGFLIVIVGGKLSEISDPYSPLIQSVKHVTENTDDKETAIFVTGYCPDSVEACPSTGDSDQLIPIYVHGAVECALVEECSELYNLPYTIKNMIADNNIGGNYFMNMRMKRRAAVVRSDAAWVNSSNFIVLLIVFSLFYL